MVPSMEPWGQLTMRADGVKVVEYVGARKPGSVIATAAPRGKPTISLATDPVATKESPQIAREEVSSTPAEGRIRRGANPSAGTPSRPASCPGGPTATM